MRKLIQQVVTLGIVTLQASEQASVCMDKGAPVASLQVVSRLAEVASLIEALVHLSVRAR